MDVIAAASTLRSQLVSLHNSDSVVTKLDSQITGLGERSLMSAMEDKQSHHLRLVLRLSVNEGVRHMYRQFSNRKWAEVQNTARSIKSSLGADDSEQTTSSHTGGSTSQDNAAGIWTSVFCELSRCD